jgi:site-specific DNA-methyltransferase (adenine-specific)
MNNTTYGPLSRPLLEQGTDTFIRYNQAISIVHKVYEKGEKSFSELVSPQTPFGIVTSYKGKIKREKNTDVKMYISGNDKQYKGSSTWAPQEKILKGHEMIPWHKVYIGEAGSGSDTFPHSILSKPFYGEPNTICNQSYLVIGPFHDKTECENVMSYISTKFFRFMVLQKKNAQHAMRGVYQFVPQQDFSKPWTDEELYKKYHLTKEEIEFIESMIKPMDLNSAEGDD